MIASDIKTGKTAYNTDAKVKITGTHVEPTIASLGGKFYASGVGGSDSIGGFTVAGLSFQPSTIIVSLKSEGAYYERYTYDATLMEYNIDNSITISDWGVGLRINLTEIPYAKGGVVGVRTFTVNSSGFIMKNLRAYGSIQWKAYS